MPDISFSPVNQCSVDYPTDADELAGPPEATEPGTEPSLPLAFQDEWDSQGAGGSTGNGSSSGAGGRGSDTLVNRFTVKDPCLPEELATIATCGGALLVMATTGGLAAGLGIVSCAAAVASLDRCLDKNDSSVR